MNTDSMKQVEIPNDYFFKMSKRDYSQFETALIREFFQNSFDANAKQVVFDLDNERLELTVFDDGIGMDYDTLTNKLLVMGQSHKQTENSVGAFGHAKILLYFSWCSWEIRTRNYIVNGSSHYYTINETDDYVDGTISTITFSDKTQYQYLKHHAASYFSKCYTPCIVYFVEDGNVYLMEQKYKTCDKFYSDENFDIYRSEYDGYYLLVRQRGVLMFSEYVGSQSKLQAIVEINKRPDELLLQNRDYFNTSVKDQFNKIKREFAIDSIETFAIKSDTVENKYLAFKFDNNDGPKKLVSHHMSEKAVEKEFNRLRSRRLLFICNAYAEMITEQFPVDDIVFGFTKNETICGLWRKNDDDNEIYINLDHVTKHTPNYRKMSIILLNTVMHEIAHAYNYKQTNSSNHDESFVKTLDSMHDIFWDTTPFTTKFKEIWKKVVAGAAVMA